MVPGILRPDGGAAQPGTRVGGLLDREGNCGRVLHLQQSMESNHGLFAERPHLDQVAELAGQPETESRARFPLGLDPARDRCVEAAGVPHLADDRETVPPDRAGPTAVFQAVAAISSAESTRSVTRFSPRPKRDALAATNPLRSARSPAELKDRRSAEVGAGGSGASKGAAMSSRPRNAGLT